MATKSEVERLAVVEEKVDRAAADIKDLSDKLDAGFKAISKQISAQDTNQDAKYETKYAAKWVQTVVGGLVSLILISVVTALLALVIKGAN